MFKFWWGIFLTSVMVCPWGIGEDGRRGRRRRRIREKDRKLKRGMGKERDVVTVGELGRRTAGGGKGEEQREGTQFPSLLASCEILDIQPNHSYAPDFTVVNYWQKLLANLAQISATGGKRVYQTPYTYRVRTHIHCIAGPFWVLWQNLRPVDPKSGKAPYHSLPLPHLYTRIYISLDEISPSVDEIYTDREFPVPSQDVTTKLSLGGNNDVITELFLPQGKFG
jgi:hypothetical protein